MRNITFHASKYPLVLIIQKFKCTKNIYCSNIQNINQAFCWYCCWSNSSDDHGTYFSFLSPLLVSPLSFGKVLILLKHSRDFLCRIIVWMEDVGLVFRESKLVEKIVIFRPGCGPRGSPRCCSRRLRRLGLVPLLKSVHGHWQDWCEVCCMR